MVNWYIYEGYIGTVARGYIGTIDSGYLGNSDIGYISTIESGQWYVDIVDSKYPYEIECWQWDRTLTWK